MERQTVAQQLGISSRHLQAMTRLNVKQRRVSLDILRRFFATLYHPDWQPGGSDFVPLNVCIDRLQASYPSNFPSEDPVDAGIQRAYREAIAEVTHLSALFAELNARYETTNKILGECQDELKKRRRKLKSEMKPVDSKINP